MTDLPGKPLHETAWYRLGELAPGAYWLTRSSVRFEGEADFDAASIPLLEILERDRPRAMVVDLRSAPSRNDAAFEAKFAPYRERMSKATQNTALLIRSKVGELQVQRLARQDGVDVEIFHEEAVARGWLLAAARR